MVAEPPAEIAVRIQDGPGPAVVWVHGYTMDSSVWTGLWSRLPGFRHIGIDLPGHGRSRDLAADERLDRLGRQVADVCASYQARHLIGLSFGGTVALQAAIERPQRLRSLVLAAAAVAGAPTDPGSEVRYTQLGELFSRFGAGPHLSTLWMSSPPDIFRAARAHPQLWAQLCAVIDRHRWSELGTGAMRSLSAHRQEEAELARISARTLVLIGDRDMPAFRYSALLLARAVPACDVVQLPEAGHLGLLERPELVAPLIDRHLRAAQATDQLTS